MGHEVEPVENPPKNSNLGIEPYPEETVDASLLALALAGGNAALAARDLRASGYTVSPGVIRDWRDKYPSRYAYWTTERAHEIEERMVREQRELVSAATVAAQQAVALEHQRIQNDEVKDAGASARNLATVAGIGTTKILEMTGRPTSIIEHRRAEDVVKRLNALVDVESDAEEDAEVAS